MASSTRATGRARKAKAAGSDTGASRQGAAAPATHPADSPRTGRLLEILELKGYRVARLPRIDPRRPGIVARGVVFKSFDDPYLVDLVELPEDEEVGQTEWKEFRRRLAASGIERGVLVTDRSFHPDVEREARSLGQVALFTFDEMLSDLIDLKPYLNNVISWWESDPLHPGEIVIPARACRARGERDFPLERHVEDWLDEPGRDPLFLLGRYGSGKTTFVKRLAARLARAHLSDPVRGRVPVLVPLKEYSTLSEMDELIVARIAELAPDQAPPSRRAFRLLLEAGRFCLILDGLDELIRRLEPGLVLKNFDKVCALILPGTKAIVTAREGYLGTPEDEAQILGLGPPVAGEGSGPALPRFERLYVEPIDDRAIQDYVGRRYPERAAHLRSLLTSRPELMELSHTPLLLELILRSAPQLEGRIHVNPAVVMSAFIDTWAELGRARRPILSSGEDALFFATEIAWHMHWGGVYRVHFTELPPRLRMRFRDRTLPLEDPDPFRADLADCPFLARDRDGHYAFVQNAFLDFLAALAYMRYLLEHGTAPVDSRRTNPDMQRFLRDLATMDERYLAAYHKLLDELRGRDDPTQWLFYRDLLPGAEKARAYAAERERVQRLQRAAPPAPPGMVHVPGGDFIFGSYEHRDESPVRRLKLAPFFIDSSPVTNREYRRFLEETAHRRPLWSDDGPLAWSGGEPPEGAEELPVTMVSLADAEAYAAWAGKRLPSEQEWELAARGQDGRRYPWGDDFDPAAVNGAEGSEGLPLAALSHPAGASVFGCQHMSGNVWEWTASRYDKFHGLKILRGGSHRSSADELRCANRMAWDPDFAKPDIGFRLVADTKAGPVPAPSPSAGSSRKKGTDG